MSKKIVILMIIMSIMFCSYVLAYCSWCQDECHDSNGVENYECCREGCGEPSYDACWWACKCYLHPDDISCTNPPTGPTGADDDGIGGCCEAYSRQTGQNGCPSGEACVVINGACSSGWNCGALDFSLDDGTTTTTTPGYGCEGDDEYPESCPYCNNCNDCILHWQADNSCGWCADDGKCRYGDSGGPDEGSCTNWIWESCPEGGSQCSQNGKTDIYEWKTEGCVVQSWNCKNCDTADDCCDVWGGCDGTFKVEKTKDYIYYVDPSLGAMECAEPSGEASIEIILSQDCYNKGEEFQMTIKFYLDGNPTDPSTENLKITGPDNTSPYEVNHLVVENGEFHADWDTGDEENVEWMGGTGVYEIEVMAIFSGGARAEATKEFEIQETCDGSSDDAHEITDCQKITDPGNYVLENNLIDLKLIETPSAAETCILIDSNDVVIDCNDFEISGSGATNSVGIDIPEPHSKIEIKNCKVKNFHFGIAGGGNVYKVNDNKFIDNKIMGNKRGIQISGDNNIIEGNEIDSGELGINLINGTANTIRGNTVTNTEQNGIRIWSSDNTIEGNTVCQSSYSDILIEPGAVYLSELPALKEENTCNTIRLHLEAPLDDICTEHCPGTSSQSSTNTPKATQPFTVTFYGEPIDQGGLAIITGPLERPIIQRIEHGDEVEVTPQSPGQLVTRAISFEPEVKITNLVQEVEEA